MSKKNTPAPKENRDYRPRATSSRSTYLLAGIGVLVVALVIGGFVWNANKSYPDVDEKVLAENAAFIVGDPITARATVDVFEDFSCPSCQQFEAQSGSALAAAAQAGQLRIRYHLLTFMDDRSPSGSYSSRAAGAIVCVARHGDVKVFDRLHSELFAKAPGPDAESDLSNEQIAEIAGQAGANEAARTCIADGAGVDEATEMADQSRQQLSNSNKGKVATPTVLVGGQPVDGIMDGDGWVGDLVTGGAST
ncbi:protein-disulfide isomerase [Gordonia iterans]|uniref:Protein-disulfide isomerase n=1 Tax=Gordonia iterans TaxID=1004901 RepID=A0A2S0KI67_9ACTN|nr:thioredoxin domain-containing protein [Gordonia iterans]AVM01380.1 protein-disulfide isomerase [Gordonia iterans]